MPPVTRFVKTIPGRKLLHHVGAFYQRIHRRHSIQMKDGKIPQPDCLLIDDIQSSWQENSWWRSFSTRSTPTTPQADHHFSDRTPGETKVSARLVSRLNGASSPTSSPPTSRPGIAILARRRPRKTFSYRRRHPYIASQTWKAAHPHRGFQLPHRHLVDHRFRPGNLKDIVTANEAARGLSVSRTSKRWWPTISTLDPGT